MRCSLAFKSAIVVNEMNPWLSDTSMTTPDCEPPRHSLTIFSQQLLVLVLVLLMMVLVIYLLREFAAMLKPLFIAGLLSYLIIPAHQWLVKRGINRPLAAISLILIVVALFSSLGLLLFANSETLVDKWPQYQQRWREMTSSLMDMLPAVLRDSLMNNTVNASTASSELRSLLGSFFSFLTMTAVVIIYLIFLLAERASMPQRLENALGKDQATRILDIFASISQAITKYLSIKTFVSVLGGVGTAIILMIFGVDFALTWGTLACVLNFIPYLGSLLATILPLMLAMVQLDSIWKVMVIGMLLVIYQQFIGVFVEPRMQGTRLGVSPLLIVLSLAFWGAVWGIVGMLLAVPLLMVIKIILENIPATKPIAVLMGM